MSETAIVATADLDAVSGAALSNEIANLSKGQVNVWSTITGTDFNSRVEVINAMGNAAPLAENLNKTINLKDVVVQQIEMADERSGELRPQPRITLIDADGTSYHVISGVVFKDLKNFFGILGMPATWPSPLPVAAETGKASTGKFITLKIAKAAPAAK